MTLTRLTSFFISWLGSQTNNVFGVNSMTQVWVYKPEVAFCVESYSTEKYKSPINLENLIVSVSRLKSCLVDLKFNIMLKLIAIPLFSVNLFMVFNLLLTATFRIVFQFYSFERKDFFRNVWLIKNQRLLIQVSSVFSWWFPPLKGSRWVSFDFAAENFRKNKKSSVARRCWLLVLGWSGPPGLKFITLVNRAGTPFEEN